MSGEINHVVSHAIVSFGSLRYRCFRRLYRGEAGPLQVLPGCLYRGEAGPLQVLPGACIEMKLVHYRCFRRLYRDEAGLFFFRSTSFLSTISSIPN